MDFSSCVRLRVIFNRRTERTVLVEQTLIRAYPVRTDAIFHGSFSRRKFFSSSQRLVVGRIISANCKNHPIKFLERIPFVGNELIPSSRLANRNLNSRCILNVQLTYSAVEFFNWWRKIDTNLPKNVWLPSKITTIVSCKFHRICFVFALTGFSHDYQPLNLSQLLPSQLQFETISLYSYTTYYLFKFFCSVSVEYSQYTFTFTKYILRIINCPNQQYNH